MRNFIIALLMLVAMPAYTAKIDVQVQSYANSNLIVDQVIAAAQAAMPSANINAAEVVRDASGKVVKVIVGLPDGDAPGLATAQTNINANAGVATSSAYPITTGLIDMSFLPGTFSTQKYGGLNVLFHGYELQAAKGNPLPSIGCGSGSGSGVPTCDSMTVRSGSNMLDGIGAWTATCDVGMHNSIGTFGVLRGSGRVCFGDGGRYSGKGCLVASATNWFVKMAGAASVDTGILIDNDTTYASVTYSLNEAGVETISAGSATASRTHPTFLRGSLAEISVDGYNEDNEEDSPLIDNCVYTVLS